MTAAGRSSSHVIIAGASTRAAADSAARAGFVVTSFDAYADLDQHPSVHAYAVRRTMHGRFSPRRAAHAARDTRADAAIYLSSFENHPAAVSLLSRNRTLWGNSAATLERARNPFDVADTLTRRGFTVPVLAHAGTPRPRGGDTDSGVRSATEWMIKPRRSGGGYGVRVWSPGSPIAAQNYLQARVEGVAGSIVFVADGRRALPLGISRQLIGEASFGATGFQYCGSMFGPAEGLFSSERRKAETLPPSGSSVREIAERLADATAEEYGLVGVNGIDFIVSGGVPFPIEINPRWCSSMELVERAHGVSVFAAHAFACARRELPPIDRAATSPWTRVVGKAIVFARHRVRVGETRAWLEQTDVRDIPRAGEEIRMGEPICTVFADAATADDCHAGLIARADDIYRLVARWRAEAA